MEAIFKGGGGGKEGWIPNGRERSWFSTHGRRSPVLHNLEGGIFAGLSNIPDDNPRGFEKEKRKRIIIK